MYHILIARRLSVIRLTTFRHFLRIWKLPLPRIPPFFHIVMQSLSLLLRSFAECRVDPKRIIAPRQSLARRANKNCSTMKISSNREVSFRNIIYMRAIYTWDPSRAAALAPNRSIVYNPSFSSRRGRPTRERTSAAINPATNVEHPPSVISV